jgi:hypothetical protein
MYQIYSFAVWLSVAAAILSGCRGPNGLIAKEQRDSGAHTYSFVDASQLIVMIDATVLGESRFGAGIVFAIENDSLFVATANHVVRAANGQTFIAAEEAYARFYTAQEREVPVRVLPMFDPDLDLAVVAIDGVVTNWLDIITFPFQLLGMSNTLQWGSGVYPIGYPERYPWGSPVKPDRVSRVDDDIIFQSNYLRAGHSGGGLFDARWRLVGMVTEEPKPPLSRAVPIEKILARLHEWHLPVSLRTDEGLRSAQQRVIPSEQVQLFVEMVDPLPIGGMSYMLELWFPGKDNKNLNYTLARERPRMVLAAIPYELIAQGVRLRIVEAARLWILDLGRVRVITATVELSADQLLRGMSANLPILPEVASQYRLRQLHIGMRVRAYPFDSEHNSGMDADPQGAIQVRPGQILRGSVDFNEGDATDHLRFDSSHEPGPCAGVLWLKDSQAVTVNEIGEVHEPTLVPLGGSGTGKAEGGTTLWRVLCGPGGSSPIRIQARMGGRATYVAVVARHGRERHVQQFFREWLEEQQRTATVPSYGEGAGVTSLGISFRAMREHLGTPATVLVPMIEKQIVGSNSLALAVAVLRDDLDTYASALLQCCSEATGVRGAVALLLAGRGAPLDESALRSTLSARDHRYVLFAIETLSKHRDIATVHRLLEPLLLNANPEIASAAKRAWDQ